MPVTYNTEGKYLTSSGVIATLAVGILQSCFSGFMTGIFITEFTNTTITFAVIIILLRFFPEPRFRISPTTFSMAVGGIILAILYLYAFNKETTNHTPQKSIDFKTCVLYIIDIGAVTPFFEELVVRKLLLVGIARWIRRAGNQIGYLMSAILVSSAFGYLHKDMMWFAFAFSMAMCAASLKGIATFDRSVFHGFYNIVVVVTPALFKLAL